MNPNDIVLNLEITQPYSFVNNTQADVRSLIHTINLLGEDIVGLELGVETGNSFMTLLHNCENIKTLHGVDNYKPYADCLKEPYTGDPGYVVDKKQQELNRSIMNNRIEYSGMKEKIVFHEVDSSEALKEFEPESLDFIFLDTYTTYEQAKDDIESWYPIVKTGGLFSGHNWNCSAIQRALEEFRTEKSIDVMVSSFDNCWAWIK